MRGLQLVLLTAALAAVACAGGAARADVVISKQATANMSCAAGVCSPTAAKAVLNATDLTNMLASGDVKVTTGSGATNIVVKEGFSWTSASRLTLDAMQSVEFDKPVTVAGTGAMTLITNDGGKNGEFVIEPERGSVQFWDLTSSLIINGQSYTLVGDIKALAADIAANPSGFYALAKPYDASADGTYASSPISNGFGGTFDGLGNTISKLSISANGKNLYGLFLAVLTTGIVRDLGVVDANFVLGDFSLIGVVAGNSGGMIGRCWASGTIRFGTGEGAGGLIGANSGLVINSSTKVKIRGTSTTFPVGGLTSYSDGSVISSYSLGSISSERSGHLEIGGLVGRNHGAIDNGFSRANLPEGRDGTGVGGLVGQNDSGAHIGMTYAAGKITAPKGRVVGGGLVENDLAASGGIADSYWDLDKGIDDPSRGAGNIPNDPGITGLTTQQLQSGLPAGFDPKIWAQKPDVNGGFPYLASAPPN